MASQLRQPSGWFGSLVMSRLLNRVNARIVDRTLELLEVRPEHNVLEIGFGGGSGLSRLLAQPGSGIITGVEISPEMLHQAERRFRRHIEGGRLRVQLGNIMQLPFPDKAFDRAFTVNTIYFWPDTEQGLRELHRVLKPEGRAAVSIRSKDKMEKSKVSTYNFRLFSAEEVAGFMRGAGFRDLVVDQRDQDKWYDQVVVVGRR